MNLSQFCQHCCDLIAARDRTAARTADFLVVAKENVHGAPERRARECACWITHVFAYISY